MDFKLFYISNCPTLCCRHRKNGVGGGTHRNSTPNIHSERNYWVCSQNTVITLLLEHVALSETKCVLSLYSKQGRRCWKHVGFSVVVWSERSALCGAPWCVGLVQTKQTFKWITCCWVKGKKKWRFIFVPDLLRVIVCYLRHGIQSSRQAFAPPQVPPKLWKSWVTSAESNLIKSSFVWLEMRTLIVFPSRWLQVGLQPPRWYADLQKMVVGGDCGGQVVHTRGTGGSFIFIVITFVSVLM